MERVEAVINRHIARDAATNMRGDDDATESAPMREGSAVRFVK